MSLAKSTHSVLHPVVSCAIAIIIAFTVPAAIASAATVELTVPIKTAFDATTASADSQTAVKLNSHYKDLGTLLGQDKDSEIKIKELHYRNEETLIALRKQIREIDADNLNKLEVQVLQTKERYKPLFAAYASLLKQITVARYAKNKTLNAVLRTQADAMKITVQLARQEIGSKQASFRKAKEATAQTIKAAREMLATIDPLKVQIKAQRSAANLPRASLSPVWTNFKYAIKKSDAKSTLDSIATLVMLTRQIVEQQQKIHALEVKIADILVKTKAQFL
ncbi:hypothetical protein [Cohnella silvisoli]|uniref:cAMP factor n=1 Tax=Cohnella silvisoli TaxID=2873699 RepID=A0ABV1KNR7_9BACL|nr:hypothetical protein [Cohnella silvisoli]MCD9020409.1 hypothetical protein [Cohnella silvisoli]